MNWVPIILLVFKLVVFGVGMFFAIKWHYDQDKKVKKQARSPAVAREERDARR